MISVSYILLCGQFLLLLAVVFLQCLEGIHSQNSSSAAPTAAPASSPTQGASSAPFTTQPELPKDEGPVDNVTVYEYRPPSPVVLCSYLPEEFIYCQDPVDHAVNHSVLLEMGHGCARWGGQTKEEVNHTQVICTALDGIECAGAREFLRDGVPCINSREPQQKGCRDQRVMEGQPSLLWRFWPRPLPEIHGTLLHHHAAVLLLPGMFRRRPLLPGPHGHGGGEAAHPGGPGNLVVRGPDPAHHRRPDAQRLQQLVHLLLRTAEPPPPPPPELLCLIFISLNRKNWTESVGC
uniref:TM2 domain containing 2 n=1 Tax=Fundulus heteroclitus TaxID=8078 RepID=A0A3Q2UQI7_FUNHE